MIKIAFCAPFPVEALKPEVKLKDPDLKLHPCSWIKALSEKLSENGEVELHIITASHNLTCDQVIKRNHITYHLMESSLPRWTKRFIKLSDSSSLWIRPLLKFRREIQRIAPDIVHGHGTEGYFSLTAVYSGYPNVISIQGIIAEVFKEEPSLRSRLVRHVEAHTVRKAKFINIKNNIAKFFVDYLSANSDKFFIEAAINEIFWSKPQPDFARNIFFVGSLIKRKGIEEFIRCYIKLKSDFSDLQGYVIGDGTDERKEFYTRIAKEAGSSEDLFFKGQLAHEKIVDIYSRGGVFCLTSHVEASSNAVMEAMAAGLPVVAMNVGDVQHRVENGTSGFLVEKKSVPGMVKSVAMLLGNESLHRSFGRKGREIASSRWKPDIIARKHMDMYSRVLEKESSRPVHALHALKRTAIGE